MSVDNEELNSLLTTIRNQEREIEMLNKEVASMRKNIEHFNEEHALREPQKPVSVKDDKAEKSAKSGNAAKTSQTVNTTKTTTSIKIEKK